MWKNNNFPIENYPKVQRHIDEQMPGSTLVNSWIISYYFKPTEEELLKDPKRKWVSIKEIGADIQNKNESSEL